VASYQDLIDIYEELDRRKRRKRFFEYYPDSGPLRRDLYKKHIAFFRAGLYFRERAAIAANRIGKTEGMGGYEVVVHATGLYPDWWPGRRFDHPIDAWAAGTTGETTRDIIQTKLVGPPEKESEWGTALIPGHLIQNYVRKARPANSLEAVIVRHVSGGSSIINFKSYEQGRKKFEGTAKHVVWFDEEPPMDIYTEGLMRTMTVDGIVLCTFTPLEGLSEVVLMFMPGGKLPGVNDMIRHVTFADWDDVPHLTEKSKRELYAALPPHQREARSKGVPSLGSGAIYPVAEEIVSVKDFVIPRHWPRAYAMDVGWNWTAALWGALDRESGVGYLYSCYKQGKAEPAIHASAIRSRGKWIPGCVDPAANGRSQRDGERLINIYQDEDLDLVNADNAVEAGLYDVWTALSSGTLKVFKSMSPWFDEYRIYRRDKNGKIVKSNDHLMDCTRYLKRTGFSRAIVMPISNNVIMNVNPRVSGRPSAMCA
jgi:phage terminase large subunit-like protein